MFAPVWERVVRGRYHCAQALVHEHARFAIAGVTYPGMVADAGGVVEGVVYYDVGSDDIAALDAFEGTDYRRDKLPVTRNGLAMIADAYIYVGAAALTNRPWQPDAFQMQHFLHTYCREKLGE